MAAKHEDPAEYLRLLGQAGDGPHDIACAALMLAALDHAGRDLDRYFDHLADLARHARDEARLAAMTATGSHTTIRKMRI